MSSPASFLQTLVDSTLGLMAFVDEHLTLRFINERLAQMLGPGATEGAALPTWIHTDDHNAVQRLVARTLVTPDREQRGSFRVRRSDGAWRILDVVSRTLNEPAFGRGVVLGAFDVTERVVVQQRLKEREEQLERAQRVARIATWELNATNGSLEASEQLFRLYGIQRQTPFTLDDLMVYFHPDDIEWIDQALTKAKQTFEPFRFVHRICPPQGGLRYVRVEGEAEFYGDTLFLFGTVQDVTEEMEAQQALRASERRFRAIFNSTFQFIGLLDPNGTLLEINRAALDLGELEAEAVQGQLLWETPWFAGDAARVERLQRAVQEAAAGAFVRYNTTVTRPDGQTATLDFSLKPVRDASGEVVTLIPEARDITEQVQAQYALSRSEELLRSVIKAMAEGVLIVNARSHILEANDSLVRMLGQSVEGLEGHSVMERLWNAVGLDGEPLDQELLPTAQALLTRQPQRDRLVGIQQDHGEVRWLLINAEPILRGDTQEIYAVVSTFYDVTEERRLRLAAEASRRKLRELTRRLQQAQEEERTRLAREVHDVLGQAMTSIRLDVRWLQDHGSPEAEYAERAAETLALVDRTIQTVRRISHTLRPGILDHFGLGAALEWQADEVASRSGLTCEVFDATDETRRLDKDLETALFRIFQEALTNVVRHADASTVTVQLYEHDGELVLDVRDDGRGIREDDLAASSSLGLLNMRERVLPWQGTVRIHGTPGGGTTVQVTIPLEHTPPAP
ncbi:MAG: PAS domain S-box protein [Bacteroidota bacterium]